VSIIPWKLFWTFKNNWKWQVTAQIKLGDYDFCCFRVMVLYCVIVLMFLFLFYHQVSRVSLYRIFGICQILLGITKVQFEQILRYIICLRANPLARWQGQLKLGTDKW
jgi:hypothetical protein